MATKEDWFRRPKARELRTLKPKYATKENLVEIVERLEPSREVAVITERIVPYGQEDSEFYSWQNFLKRGTPVTLKHQTPHEKPASPTKLRDEQFEKLLEGDYTGYQWYSPDGKKRKFVSLVTCIEGLRLFHFSSRSSRPEDRIKVKAYHSEAESPEFGFTFEAEVPSRSRKGHYPPFSFVSVPVLRNEERYTIWRRLHTKGHESGKKYKGYAGCEFKHYMQLTFRRPEVDVFCPHEVAAYLKISEWVKNQCKNGRRNYNLIIPQPFALPTVQTASYEDKLVHNAMMELLEPDKQGWNRLKRRPLHLAEVEAALWLYVRKHAKERPFFATQGPQAYRWLATKQGE